MPDALSWVWSLKEWMAREPPDTIDIYILAHVSKCHPAILRAQISVHTTVCCFYATCLLGL